MYSYMECASEESLRALIRRAQKDRDYYAKRVRSLEDEIAELENYLDILVENRNERM